MLSEIKKELRKQGDPQKARILQRFFKTGPGEYAEGDQFLGITVPVMRALSIRYAALSLTDATKLLHSRIHESRLLALLILIRQFQRADKKEQAVIYRLYLKHTRFINNWDLVDASAKHIVGAFLYKRDRNILTRLARSRLLWERRIGIIATFYFIERHQFQDTFRIAKILLKDPHDLIHKAVGWMLRETGKRNLAEEEKFLKKYYRQMPRTALRYAIERFPESMRLSYLKAKIIR